MGWEQRGNGRYYYRKHWQDGRCVSVYLGTGKTAHLLADCEHYRRLEAAEAREVKRQARAELEATDLALAEYADLTRTLTTAVLVTNGYHQHKGQWRRRRGH